MSTAVSTIKLLGPQLKKAYYEIFYLKITRNMSLNSVHAFKRIHGVNMLNLVSTHLQGY